MASYFQSDSATNWGFKANKVEMNGDSFKKNEELYHQIRNLRSHDPECTSFSLASSVATYSESSPLGLRGERKLRHINQVEDMVNMLKRNNRVLVTATDYAYLNAFYVCYTTSRLWRFRNFFVVALNQHAYDVLEQQGFPVALVSSSDYASGGDTPSLYDGYAFNQLTALKLIAVQKVLNMGVNCLFFDSDVVIFQNPFKYVPTDEEFDFIAQKDATICSGFVYWRPTERSLTTLQFTLQKMKERNIHDQTALVEVVENQLVPGLKSLLFEPMLYNRGSIYFEMHQFGWGPHSRRKENRVNE